MVKLYHLTDAAAALRALNVGHLNSEAEETFRMVAERRESFREAQDAKELLHSQNRYKQFGRWFRANHLQFQTEFDSKRFICWHDESTKYDLVLFHFETEGYVGAQKFEFLDTDPNRNIRTVLSKTEPDESLAWRVHSGWVGVPTMSLEDCTSISAMSGILVDAQIGINESENEYVKKIQMNILYRRNDECYEFLGY